MNRKVLSRAVYWISLQIIGLVTVVVLIGHWYYGQPICTPTQQAFNNAAMAKFVARFEAADKTHIERAMPPVGEGLLPCLGPEDTFAAQKRLFHEQMEHNFPAAMSASLLVGCALFMLGFAWAVLLHSFISFGKHLWVRYV